MRYPHQGHGTGVLHLITVVYAVCAVWMRAAQLVTPHDVDLCKQRMNTFAYVGDLKSEPEVACVYHSEEVGEA